MNETEKYNLTQGSIVKKLFMVAVPIMGTQFMQMAYNLIDMFWLGRVSNVAVAASGAAGMYLWLSFGFLLIGRMGAEIGVSQSLGSGQKQQALEFFQHALFINIILGVIFSLVMIFQSRTLAAFFPFTETVLLDNTAAYIFIVGFGIVPSFISAVIACAFTAAGNSRTPFILNTIGLVCNVILDPICILVLDLGIRGAALATILSQFLVFTLLVVGITCFKHRPFEMHALRLDKKKLLQILKWSVPIGLESIFFCFLTMLSARIEARFGANAMAVGKIGSQIESLSWLIGGGFGSALVIFVGQNYGAGRQDRIQQGVRISSCIMTGWGILVTALLCFAGHWVFSIFLPDPEIARLGRYYCYIFAFCQLPMNLEAVWSGAFKGTGRTIPPSLVSMASNTLKPILALILSQTSLGLYGIWVGVSGADAIRGIWILIWYRVSEAKQHNTIVQ